MSPEETDSLITHIFDNYKNSWDQTRMIATAFCGEEITFPWDDVKKEITTQEDLQKSYQDYLNSINKI